MYKIMMLALTAILLLPQCKIVKYIPEKFPAKQIIFGDGGGFAGIETSYLLLENGQIFKRKGVNSPYLELTSIRKKQSIALFEKLKTIQLYKLDIDKPGNLYYFLQEVTEETDSKAIWGSGDYLPPQSLVTIHRELLAIAKSRTLLKPEQVKADADKSPKVEEDKTKW